MTGRTVSKALLVLALALVLDGCGRAGRPEFPDGTTYPLTYPNRALGPAPKNEVNTGTANRERVFVDPSVRAVQTTTPGAMKSNTSPSPLDETRESSESFSPLPALQPPLPMQAQ